MKRGIFYEELKKIETTFQKKVLTAEDAARYAGITPEEMESVIEKGDIRSITISGTKRIRSVDLAAWLTGDKGEAESVLDNTLTQALPSPIIENVSEEEFEVIRREKGTGSVYYNEKRKCWQAAFYMVENGEKKRKIISGKTEDEVIFKMGLLRSGQMAYFNEDELPAQLKPKHKITDIWHYILENTIKPGCTSRTYRWYSDIGKHIEKAFGDKYIEDLTSADIQRFLNGKRTYEVEVWHQGRKQIITKQYSDKTLKEISTQLKKICNYALEEGYITKNPYNRNVRRPKGIKNDPRDTVLDREALVKLVKAASKKPKLKAIVYTLLLTGLRTGELLALKWSDLDRENNCILVNGAIAPVYDECVDGKFRIREYIRKKTKTSAGKRILPVHPSLFKILHDWRNYITEYRTDNGIFIDIDENDLIFANYSNGIRSYSSIRRDFDEFLVSNGLQNNNGKKITLHCLRRTTASYMLNAGVRLEVVAAYLGHKVKDDNVPAVTSDHYAKVMLEPKEEAAQKYYEYMKDIFELALEDKGEKDEAKNFPMSESRDMLSV